MRRVLPLVVFGLSVAAVATSGQQRQDTDRSPQTPAFRSDVDVVSLNVTVTDADRTRLERPADLEGKEFFTDEEFAERQAEPRVDTMFVGPSPIPAITRQVMRPERLRDRHEVLEFLDPVITSSSTTRSRGPDRFQVIEVYLAETNRGVA